MGKMHRKEIWSIFARVLEGNDQLLKNKSGYKKHAKRQIMMYFNASWVRKYLLLLVFAILALPVLGGGTNASYAGDSRKGAAGSYEFVTFQGIPTDEQRAELQRYGVQILRYVSAPGAGRFTYLAYVLKDNTLSWKKIRGSENTVGVLRSRGGVQTLEMERYSWVEKCDSELVEAYWSGSVRALPDWCISESEGAVKVVVDYVKEVGESLVREELEGLPMLVDYVSRFGAYAQGVIQISDLRKLAERTWVVAVKLASPPEELENEKSAALVGVRELQSLEGLGKGLTGKGVRVGIFDGTVARHKDFGSRLHVMESQGGQSAHGTHVSGTVAGMGLLDRQARGMAPEASLYTWNFTGDVPSKYLTAIADYGVRIAQNSYGVALADNLGKCRAERVLPYNSLNKGVDEVLFANPTLSAIFSTGNSQGDCDRYKGGYRSVTRSAKNVITVGAVDAMGGMTDFSSWGPLYDGRLAPLVCADGYKVWSTSFNDGYESMSGTSMACPAVSGLTALLYQQFRASNNGTDPQFILIKNALLNTATDAGRKGPDFQYGYGIVNGVKASDLLSERRYALEEIGRGDVHAKQVISVPENVSKLRVMIVWHDPATQSHDRDLVNDLDLEVRGPQRVFRPWVLDATNFMAPATRGREDRNNHEQVEIENPPAGQYTAVVTAYRIPDGKVPYSLTWEFEYSRPSIELTYPQGGEIFVSNGKSFPVRWVNASPSRPVDVQVSYDNGATWATATTSEPGAWQTEVSIPDAHAFEEKVLVRVAQDGIFAVSKAPFSIEPNLEAESVHTLCAQDPTVRWKNMGVGVTYNVSYFDKAAGTYDVIKTDLRDTSLLLSGYDESRPIAVQVCRGAHCSKYSTPVFPHSTRPVVIAKDKSKSFRLDDNGDIGNVYSWLTLGDKTYAAHQKGLVFAYGDKDRSWKDPAEADGGDVFEKNPLHVASLWLCIDLQSIRAEELTGKSVASIVTVVPMNQVGKSDPGGHSAWVRLVACNERGEDVQVLENSQGVRVRNAGMTVEQLRGSDFDLTPYVGQRVVLRADMALKGSNAKGINDAAMVGGAQFAVVAQKDVSVSGLMVPTSSVALGSQEAVSVELKNLAQRSLVEEKVTIRLYDGSDLLGEWEPSLSINGLSKITYELPQRFDFSTPMRKYALRAEIEVNGDGNVRNNVTAASVTNLQGYVLMPALNREPSFKDEKTEEIGEGKRIFTDDMGPNDPVTLRVQGSTGEVRSVGVLNLKPQTDGKYVKFSMREVDLGKNVLEVYLVEGRHSKKCIYRFTGSEGVGVALSTQKADEVLQFKYETNDAEHTVQGWVAEVVQVDSPTANVSNDLFVVTGLTAKAGSTAGHRVLEMHYKNLTGEKKGHVKAGLFVTDWSGNSTPKCVDEFTVGSEPEEQIHAFSKEIELQKNEELRLFALMDGQDGILENNVQYVRLYDGDYTPVTSIQTLNEEKGYAGAQLAEVRLGKTSVTVPTVNKQYELHNFPQNHRDKVFRLEPAATMEIELTFAGISRISGASASIWVDWDGDKVLGSTAEEFVGRVSCDYKSTEQRLTLKVPTGVLGDRLMRVVTLNDKKVEATLENNKQLGDVKDFTLRVEPFTGPAIKKDLAILYADLSVENKTLLVHLQNNSVSEKLTDMPLYVKVDDNPEEEYSQTFSLAAGEETDITLPLNDAQKGQLTADGNYSVSVCHRYAEDEKRENDQRLLSCIVKNPVPPVAGAYALTFDGSGGSARMADFDESQMQKQTYEAWVRLDKFALRAGASGLNRLFETSRTAVYFCGEGHPTLPSKSVILLLSDGKIYTSAPNSVVLGQWMHVAVTIDRSGAEPVGKIYLNGEDVTMDFGKGSALKTEGLIVGNRDDGGRSLIGAVDIFRVWSEIRQETQIKEYMNRRNATGEALYADFDFSEGEGSLLTSSNDGKKSFSLSEQGVSWEPEPRLEVKSWGVANTDERKDTDSQWTLRFVDADATRHVQFAPLCNFPAVDLKVGGAPIASPIDMSSGSCNVGVTWSWLDGTETDVITVRACTPLVNQPEIKGLTVGDVVVAVSKDMVVTLPADADLRDVKIAFSVEPAGSVVKIGGSEIANGGKVNLERPVLVDVYSASGFEKSTYQLTAVKTVGVTWTASTFEYTYGDENIVPFDAVAESGTVFYSVEDEAVLQVVGAQPKINGVGTTRIVARAVINGRPMAGGIERTVSVRKAPLRVKTNDVTVDFSDPVPSEYKVVYDGFVYGEDERDLTTRASASCAAKQGDAHGTYTIAVSGAEAKNYAITYIPGVLTIRDVEHYAVTFQLKAPVENPTMSLSGLKLKIADREFTTDNDGKVLVDLKKRDEAYVWSFAGGVFEPKLEDERGAVVFDAPKTVAIQLRTFAPRLKVIYVAEAGKGTLNGEQTLTFEVRRGDPAPAVKAEPMHGYSFSGWASTDDDLSDEQKASAELTVAAVTKDGVVYTAKFAKLQYTVQYTVAGNGKIEGAAVQTKEYEEMTEPVEAKPLGNEIFVGWNDGKNEARRSDRVLADRTYVAKFVMARTLPFTEDFEDNSPTRGDWENEGENGQAWKFIEQAGSKYVAKKIGTGLAAGFDMLSAAEGVAIKISLATPVFDVSKNSSVTIAYDFMSALTSTDKSHLSVEYSLDGKEFVKLKEYPFWYSTHTDKYSTTLGEELIKSARTLQVRWIFESAEKSTHSGSYILIDNVNISGPVMATEYTLAYGVDGALGLLEVDGVERGASYSAEVARGERGPSVSVVVRDVAKFAFKGWDDGIKDNPRQDVANGAVDVKALIGPRCDIPINVVSDYVETFESALSCWDMSAPSMGAEWRQDPSQCGTTGNGIRVDADGMNPTAPLQTLELRTPLYDLSHLANAEVSFNYTFADVLCGYSLILQYSIDGGDQWQTLLQFEPHKYTHNDLVTNGEFRMALPKLSGRVCFKWETTVEFTRRAGAFAMDNFSITGVPVPPTVATLAFEVVDAEGAVQGASVSLQGVSGAQTTDAAGKASFAGLSLQSYTYTVSKAGYDDATGTVALAAGGVLEKVTLRKLVTPLAVATLAFEVVDAEGAVQGASVSLQGVSGAQVTDAEGKASFAGLSLQSYTYTVSKAGYGDATGTVALAAGGVLEKVTMRKLVTPLTVATLAFEVVDAEGAVQGASVSLQGVSGVQVTDAAGKASFAGLSLQSYTYTVSKAGYDDATGTVALAAEGALEKVTMRKLVTAVLASSLPYVAVRPNPAKSTLFVENVEGVQRLRVVSLRGEELRLRLNKDRERVVSILLDGLSEGMYLLVVEGEGARRVIPFVVVR